MIEKKSDQRSIRFKNLGNRFYKDNRFSEALIEYNKALNYAVSKENVAIAYANRSAVYLEDEKYERCLQNIQWALENEYPSDKVQKLLERKTKCEEMMKKKTENSNEVVKEFFKLSYPANPKIPFIIDGLEVRMTKKMGRGIFTTRDLMPGDIISVEEPVLNSMAVNGQYSSCCNCLTSRGKNLIPCLKTASLMFCSVKCRDEIYKKVKAENFEHLICEDSPSLFAKILNEYEFAFGGRENLMNFIRENNFKKWKKTVFDYDFSNRDDPHYKLNALKSILSYFAPMDYNANKNCNSKEIEKITNGNAVLKGFLEHMGIVWGTNVMAVIQNGDSGISLENPIADHDEMRQFGTQEFRFHLFSPLMNYSCFPNVLRVTTDAHIFLYVTRPIKAGEQLFRGVSAPEIFNQSPEQRRTHYRFNCCFLCQCYYCEKGLTATTLPCGKVPFPIDGYGGLISMKNKIEKIKKNFKIIEKYEEESPNGTVDSFCTGLANYTLMNHLGGFLEF